jgi:predicted outer membrane protein
MRIAFAGLVVAALSCSLALAQNVAQPGAPGQRVQGGQITQPGQPAQPGQIRGGQAVQPGQVGLASTSDQEIAAKIYGFCHNEVELAKFAQSRAKSQDAKEFVDMMIKDHTPDCEAYAKFAGNLISHGRQAAGQPQGGRANWVSIHNELAQQCLQSTQKELSQKEGAEFDQCFMTQQAVSHHIMKDSLTVLRKHASPQLAQQIDNSLEVVNAHLEQAKEIAKKLEDRPSERVSRRPEGN